MRWRFVWYGVKWLLTAVLLIIFLGPEWPEFGDERYQLRALVGLRQFDFLAWQFGAYLDKGVGVLADGETFVPEPAQQQFVLDYLALVAEANQLEQEIVALLADPTGATTAAKQRQLAETRTAVAERQTLAEAIVQRQVATILIEEGFSLGGTAWPPVLMQMTPLPSILIISPRERIERLDGVSLQRGLSAAAWDGLETAVLQQLDRSALVVPIGGLGTYPAMITETSSINWLVEVTAHEWTHHWLGLKPLGVNYLANNDLRTINETVASMVDVEVAAQVIARYYPAFVPPEAEVAQEDGADGTAVSPPPFDFRVEMAATRIQADELLAAGDIAAAEMYMEARRRVFVANGYQIRKLNQAYFAFYGAYAAQPGATGSDPIGPLLRQLRAQSPSLRAFLDAVAPITSLTQLEQLVGANGR